MIRAADVGEQEGTSFLVMEYLEGDTLSDRLRKGPMPWEQVLRVGAKICEGLEKAYRNGIVHRDLKPSNVMLTKSWAKLMDFGLAKPNDSTSGSKSGTPAYSAVATLASMASPLTMAGTVVGTLQVGSFLQHWSQTERNRRLPCFPQTACTPAVT